MSYLAALASAQQVFESLKPFAPVVEQIAATMQTTLGQGGRILICGNGGSGCEAQHLATELVGHYKTDRAAFSAIALSADGALLTCIGNDFAFEDIFARQVEGLGNPGDVLIVFTTSGNSRNVARALEAARQRGLKTIALLGRGGGAARGQADIELIVASDETARIQEAHQFLLHAIMDVIEAVEE
ncbi:MAG: SIS domain-containing protein [Blastocatellia bacterium]